MTALPETTEKKLGLVIDLDTCVGCHACVINCKEWNTSNYGAPLADTRLALLFAPQRWDRIVLMLQQSETQHRGTMCLVALRHWLCEHDVAPATLQAAVQSAGIDDVPRDSFTDSALKLTTVDAQTVIYSIGPDGQDDDGQVEWAGDTPSGKGDLSFRLHSRKPKSR